MSHTIDPSDLTYIHDRPIIVALGPGSAVLDADHLYWECHENSQWWCYGVWERSGETTPIGPHAPTVIPLPAVLLPPKEPTR